MPSGHDAEGLLVRPDLPGNREIQVFELRPARLHIGQLTFQYHHPFVAHNQQVHLAMTGPIQIGKLKPLSVFRAGDCRCKGFLISQPRCLRAFWPGLWQISRPQAQRRVMQPGDCSETHAAPFGLTFGGKTFRSSTHNKISPFRASSTNSAAGVSFGAYRKNPSDLTGNGPSSSRCHTRSFPKSESL